MEAMERHGRLVKLGDREVEFPSRDLQELESANHILYDRQALLWELDTKGYLFIRNLHDREEVFEARRAVLEFIHSSGQEKLDSDFPVHDGILHQRCGLGCIPFMEGVTDITHHEKVKLVLEGDRPKQFFSRLLNEDCKTFDFKWLRGIHRQAFTGAHVDSVYMSWGTPELYTMWTPFDDVTVEMGTLAMCEGSCSLPSFQKFQEAYGNFDTEKSNHQGTGWFTTDPFEITSKFQGQWKTADFRAGDVMVFGMRTVHMSTANLTDKVRISCDTRWLRKSAKADPRYIGDNFDIKQKFGLYAKSENKSESKTGPSMDELKVIWGL